MTVTKLPTAVELLNKRVETLAAQATASDLRDANTIALGVSTTGTVITPVVAAVLLTQYNNRNRDLSMTNVKKYSGAMKRGEWMLNNQGIGFMHTGIVSDGQHRLYACVESNTPFKVLVTTGLPESVVDTVDQGHGRSLADMLKIKKYAEPVLKAVMTKRYMDYRDKLGGRSHTTYTMTQGEEFIIRHADNLDVGVGITNLIQETVSSQQPLKRGDVASIVFTLISLGADPGKTMEFMNSVQNGITDGQGQEASVVIVLSRIFGRSRFSTRTTDRLSITHKTALAIKGFNNWARGKKIARLSWTVRDGYPGMVKQSV